MFYIANMTAGTLYKGGFTSRDAALSAASRKFAEGKGAQIAVVELVGTIEPVCIIRTGDKTMVVAGETVLGELTQTAAPLAEMTPHEAIERAG